MTGRVRFPALGTTAEVVVTDRAVLGRAVDMLGVQLDAVDRACSRFRTDSEISRLHEHSGRETRVGPLLADAIEVALRAARLTDGLVDLTVGAAMRALGYDRDFAALPADTDDTEIPVAASGWHRIMFDRRTATMLTPVLVLSALVNPADRVAGLDAGAEDYLGKPFNIEELLARLRALRRRHLDTARTLPLPGGSVDIEGREAIVAGNVVSLSERECALLVALATRPTRVFTRAELRRLVFEDVGPEVVESYVHYLRRKLGPGVVATVRGRGYRLGRAR